jgi:hypothetical protein
MHGTLKAYYLALELSDHSNLVNIFDNLVIYPRSLIRNSKKRSSLKLVS